MSKRRARKIRLARQRAKERRQAERVTHILLGEFDVGDRVRVDPKAFFPNPHWVQGRIQRVTPIDHASYPNGKAYEIRLEDIRDMNYMSRPVFWAANDMLTHIGDTP